LNNTLDTKCGYGSKSVKWLEVGRATNIWFPK